MNIHKYTSPSGENMIALSESDYYALILTDEDRADIAIVDNFYRRLAAGEEEMIPSEMVDRILNGKNLTRVWREHRGLTIKALAAMIDVAPAYLSQIETGKRDGTVKTMQRIAKALGLKLDDLVSMD
jgi:DNA-binding XRE family transcriptional regulator